MSPSDLAIVDVRRTTPTLAEVNDFIGTAYATISLSDKLIQSLSHLPERNLLLLQYILS